MDLTIKNKVVLCTVAPVSHRTAEENLGIGYLASSLRKANYEVIIIDAWLRAIEDDIIIEKILGMNNLVLIGFSCYQTNIPRTVELMKSLKKRIPKMPILCGGFGPTFNSKYFIEEGFDIAARGEGEDIIIEVCNYYTKRNPSSLKLIKGITFKDENTGMIVETENPPLQENLDLISFPSRETMQLSMNRKSYVNISTSRGCCGNCLFCSVIAFFRMSHGSHWRGRSVINIVDEIEEIYNKGARYIKAVDDSFIEEYRDENWCKEFADELERRNIKIILRSAIRADRVNEGIIRELKRAGFISFSVGIENGSPTALKRMNKGANLKANIKALELFKKYNIYMQAGFILFDYDTTMQELKENYEFLSKYWWMITKGIFSEMFAAEGTPYTKKLRNQNVVHGDFSVGNNDYVIKDKNVYKVYIALKIWHKSHAHLYDMAVDPLSSPKAIDMKTFELFYSYLIKLKKIDIKFMGDVLEYVNTNIDIDVPTMIKFAHERINNNKKVHKAIEDEITKIYRSAQLVYDADDNPFI